MKKILIIILSILSLSLLSQNKKDYKIIYSLKIEGINSPGEAKMIKSDLYKLFDSSWQEFSVDDSIISIRSSFDESEIVFKKKLTSYGYSVTFSKKQ